MISMTIATRMLNSTIKGITRLRVWWMIPIWLWFRVHGPLILVANHVNFLDAPIFMTHLQPRKINALVKEETWKNPFLGALFTFWGGIPIKRGVVDMKAYQRAVACLNAGNFLAVAPEGTRSKTGCLQKGYPGITIIAAKTKTPILPIAFYGGEVIWDNLHHLIRTPFHIRVGKAFTISPEARNK